MHFVLELNQQLRGVIKNERTDRKGGAAPSVLTISKCENFDPFFSMKYDSMMLKTHVISL